jgi:hypothetical protein
MVSAHLKKKHVETETQAGGLDPTDIGRAKEVADKYVSTRLGKRLDDARRNELINRAVGMIGVFRRPPPRLPTPKSPVRPTTSNPWKVVGSPTRSGQPQLTALSDSTRKRGPPVISPATSIGNRFEVLDVELIDDNDENKTGPPRTPTTATPLTKRLRPSTDRMRTPVGVFIHTGSKDTWSIQPAAETTTVIIGDSNVRRITNIPSNWEVHCLSGAKLCHVAGAISRLESEDQVDVIIQAGINHREKHDEVTLSDIDDVAEELFRHQKIRSAYVVGVSIPRSLPQDHIDNLRLLNRALKTRCDQDCLFYLDGVDEEAVYINPTDKWGIHYTAATADKLMSKIHGTVSSRVF